MTVPPQYQPFPDDEPDGDEPVQTPGTRYAAPPPPSTPAGPFGSTPYAPGARPPGNTNAAGNQAAQETSTAPEPDADEAIEGGIGILGPPGSGKTTFLGAIRVALEQQQAGLIYGTDEGSQSFLVEASDRLHRQRVFPNATRALPPNLSFNLRIQRTNVLVTTAWRRKRVNKTAVVSLEVLDPPGGMYGSHTPAAYPKPNVPQPQGASAYAATDLKRLAEHLAGSSGLILLLDPVREAQENDSYDHFQRIIVEIAARARFRRNDLHLPHHLAICMTKFDHPLVYNTVNRQGFYVEQRGDMEFPYAPPETAREYFNHLCRERRGGADRSDSNSTLRLRNVIQQFFSPHRTRFFLTSAVGFRTDPQTGRFQPTAPENVSYQELGGEAGQWILGEAHPVSVLEPVMWLVRQQLKESGR